MLSRRKETAPARKALYALTAVVLASAGIVRAQAPAYSSSQEYKSLLQELRDNPVRPSRMGTGTLLAEQPAPPQLKVRDDSVALRIISPLWKLEITKQRWQMAFTNQRTGLVWRLDAKPQGSGAAESGVTWTRSLDDSTQTTALAAVRSVERHGDQWRMQVALAGSAAIATVEIDVLAATILRLSIRVPESDTNAQALNLHFVAQGPFFGLGERFDRVKLDGLQTTLRPEDLFGKPGHNWTYIPVPFLFTPRGLGLYLDTAKVTTFNLSGASQGDISARSGRCFTRRLLIRRHTEGNSCSLHLAHRAHTRAAAWTYGVWICSYRSPDAVLRDARSLREDKIPVSAIWTFDVMDKGDIMGWPLWWTGYYPDPRKFTDQLHAMGFKSLTYIHPYLRSVLDPYNLPQPGIPGRRS